ncbi:hypothetical protein BVY03_06005, partial [bacterium K02(2017)]
MRFFYPEAFYLLIPWFLFCSLLFFNQNLAHSWLKSKIHQRFITQFTRYTFTTLCIHLLIIFIAGICLIYTLASPYRAGSIENLSKSRNIFFILDSSYSMEAIDTYKTTSISLRSKSRLEVSKGIINELIEILPEDKIGLITFSGSSITHATPTLDHSAIKNMVSNLSTHSLRGTGSIFSKPLGEIIHTAQFQPDNYLAILLSDGEPIPNKQNFNHELEILEIAGIPIYTIGIGSDNGAQVSLFNPHDVYNKIDNPRVAKVIDTYRKDSYLKKISSATGGKYFELEDGTWVSDVKAALNSYKGKQAIKTAQGKIDHSHPALI